MHIKRGTIREDGMIFWGYCGKTPDGQPFPYWLKPEIYEREREKAKARLKARYASRKQEYYEKQKAYREKNKEKVFESKRRYRAKNAEKIRLRKQKYSAENREKIAKWIADRRAKNPIVRMANSMRRSIRRYLDAGQKGEMSSFEIIGCSKDDLRKHLESKFRDGMTWQNYGSYWHIDHIVPLISAKSPEEVKRLCHWANLQPLTAFDNISKGSKMPLAIDASSDERIDRIDS
jgi:hypothetical protein